MTETERSEYPEEPDESALSEEVVEGQLEELDLEELAELEDDEIEGVDE